MVFDLLIKKWNSITNIKIDATKLTVDPVFLKTQEYRRLKENILNAFELSQQYLEVYIPEELAIVGLIAKHVDEKKKKDVDSKAENGEKANSPQTKKTPSDSTQKPEGDEKQKTQEIQVRKQEVIQYGLSAPYIVVERNYLSTLENLSWFSLTYLQKNRGGITPTRPDIPYSLDKLDLTEIQLFDFSKNLRTYLRILIDLHNRIQSIKEAQIVDFKRKQAELLGINEQTEKAQVVSEQVAELVQKNAEARKKKEAEMVIPPSKEVIQILSNAKDIYTILKMNIVPLLDLIENCVEEQAEERLGVHFHLDT